jgi:hypothetical protein
VWPVIADCSTYSIYQRRCHGRWWRIRSAPATPFGPVFIMRQSRQAFFSWSQAPSNFFCEHLHHSPGDMTLHPHLASVALKRNLAARGRRAPPWLSIVGWFCRLPWQVSGADSVAPAVCHLALVAARAPPAVSGEDAQSDSKHATIPDGPEAGEPVGTWPRSVLPALLCYDAPSDSPAQ